MRRSSAATVRTVSIFTAQHLRRAVLAMSEMSVRLSVHLSVKRANCDRTKETCANILIPHERMFTLVLRHEKWLVAVDTLYLKLSVNCCIWK